MAVNHVSIQNALRAKAVTLSVATAGTAFSRASTATYFDVNGVMRTAGINVLRNANYANGVGPSILFEGTTTNFAGNSQDFTISASWAVDNSGTGAIPTVTPNAGIAPDGTLTANRIQFSKTAGVGFSRIHSKTASIASGTYVVSVYLKTNDASYASLSIGDVTANRRVISVTPNWQRFSITTAPATTVPELELLIWNTTTTSSTADILAWGCQIESAGTTSTFYNPNNASISQSDYCTIATADASRISLQRPIVDGQDYNYYNPAARIARFKTDSSYIGIHLDYTELFTRTDTYNALGWVYVDGVAWEPFNQVIAAATGTTVSVIIELLTAPQMKTVEVILPYGISVDFTGVDLESTATISAATARPTTRLVVAGDSITQGYVASSAVTSWPFLLAAAKNWQIINNGIGSRTVVASDGTALGNLNPTVATYLIGYNNFINQTALATFKSIYTSFVNNFRAVCPNVKLYCITPTWSANTNTLTLEMYRQQIRDALTALNNPLNVLVEGLTLATNSSSSFTPDPHPNDTGSAEIATALGALISV